MKDISIQAIGIVQNKFDEPIAHHEIKRGESIIYIDEAYTEALLNIENSEFIDVVFYFHKSEPGRLTGKTHSGETRGVFASRSPHRPNGIGVTSVKLLKRDGNKLFVTGLDAINQTPVIDIKCSDTSILELDSESKAHHNAVLKSNPRIEINNLIKQNNTEQLMIKASQLHGHFCPGLAMGVLAATYAMCEMDVLSDGMEDLLAITETNNCFSDGVQFITGCSFGNNSLVFKDLGKTAFTLSMRDGKGIRICSRHESQALIKNQFPAFNELYQLVVVEQNHNAEKVAQFKKAGLDRAFKTLHIDFDKLFTVQHIQTEIPSYARIHESYVCKTCGESVMSTRTNGNAQHPVCYECENKSYLMLDGNGIQKKIS